MKAVVITNKGLRVSEIERPTPGAGQMLVKVHAAALNRADLFMSTGARHGKTGGAGGVAGLEWAGIVVALGEGVSEYCVGDRVMCSGSGGYAEFAVSDPYRANPIPDGVGFAEAATLPVALQTMHDALVTNGRLSQGEAVLIQGASSGVGILGMQIAKEMGASLVIGTSTNAERRALLAGLGADAALDTRNSQWPEEVKRLTGGKGVELIVDQVAGKTMNENMAAAALCGRIVNVGRLGGMTAEFNFDLHALKRLHYIGVTFRTRTREEVLAVNRAMRSDLWPAVSAGRLRVPIDRVFPLEQAVEAQAYMAANSHLGKIILQVQD